MRDLALILTALLTGLRADELRQADIGDIRTTDDGAAVIRVKGKGGQEHSVPFEGELLLVIETYLNIRATRFPGATRRDAEVADSALSRWPAKAALFVGRDGERIPAACSNLESNVPSNAQAPTHSPCPVRSCTACDILTQRSWLVPM